MSYHLPRLLQQVVVVATVLCTTAFGQQKEFKQFQPATVFDQLDVDESNAPHQPYESSWWDKHVTNSLRQHEPLTADIHTLLFLAVHHSNQIKIASRDPLIRETAIMEADANFDWTQYLNTAWNDTSEPVGNSLIVGGNRDRFNDHVFQGAAGIRRLNRRGGLLDISQRFGWQNNNSTFLIPEEQATGQFTISYTHPLLRGNGVSYNNSIVFLASIDSKVAQHEFLGILQDELLEIVRSYWALYLERAVLAHQMRLFLKTEEIFNTLEARQSVDTQRTQLIVAASALENRRSDLIRGRTAVTNAETRLRGLINAPELSVSDQVELIPSELPATESYPIDLQSEIQTAIQNRPESMAAIQQVKAGTIRLGVAQHEFLPVLNLVTQTYANGLRGNSNFGNSFTDQFTEGAPSYSIGFQYERPIGNRLARARICRRKHELAKLQDEYARALETIQTEVDVAVRELKTSRLEIAAKKRALAAAEAEAKTIETRWTRMIDGNGTAGLNLESLLRAQERVTDAERDYVTSVLTYNLAVVNLKRSNGTLLQSENVTVGHACENGCKVMVLDKGAPTDSFDEFLPTQGVPIDQAPLEIHQSPSEIYQSPLQNHEAPLDIPNAPVLDTTTTTTEVVDPASSKMPSIIQRISNPKSILDDETANSEDGIAFDRPSPRKRSTDRSL